MKVQIDEGVSENVKAINLILVAVSLFDNLTELYKAIELIDKIGDNKSILYGADDAHIWISDKDSGERLMIITEN